MRRVLATGLILGLTCQLWIPALASPLGGGIGQGFESGLGWGLCTALGKGVVKAARAIKGRNHKNDSAQSADNKQMGPEDYYNRGLEEGYARAREEGGRYGADDRYQDRQDNRYADSTYGSRDNVEEKRVYARRLAESPATGRPQSAARRTRKKAQAVSHPQPRTVAAAGQKSGTKLANRPANKNARSSDKSKQTLIDLANKP